MNFQFNYFDFLFVQINFWFAMFFLRHALYNLSYLQIYYLTDFTCKGISHHKISYMVWVYDLYKLYAASTTWLRARYSCKWHRIITVQYYRVNGCQCCCKKGSKAWTLQLQYIFAFGCDRFQVIGHLSLSKPFRSNIQSFVISFAFFKSNKLMQ